MLRPSGHRPSGREHERARSNVKRRLGANPRTGFRHPLVLYAVRSGGTLERRTHCRCKAGTDQKYDDEKQVQRGDTPSSGLAPPDKVLRQVSRGRQRCEATENSTARPSGPADERPCLSVSVVRRRDKSAVF